MRLVALLSIGLASLSGISVCFAKETTDEALENQGICPPTKWLSSCSPPVAHDCVVDVDCGLKDKCCYNGCYMTCKAPNEGKLGQKQRLCAQPVDLVFMIDSSESFGLENFERVKKMAHKTLNVFAVSEKKTRVSVIVIDSVPHIDLNFTTFKGSSLTTKNVMKVVNGLQFTRGQTRIDLALRMTQKEIFSKLGGARKDARKILIVFTDGLQTWDPRTTYSNRKLSDQLVKAGVQIFPVAIWKEKLNIGTLTDIASNLHHIFNAEFYPYLLQLLKKISKGPCSENRHKNVWENTLKKMTKKE